MSIILATGLSSIESKIESKDLIRCYHRSIITEVTKELNPEAVVLSPHLNGEEDLLKEVIIPLRESGVRVIFLPGSINETDAKEWVKKLIPWGVYCYVFDPVTADKIIHRIKNPGRIKDLPEEIAQSIGEDTKLDKAVEEALTSVALEKPKIKKAVKEKPKREAKTNLKNLFAKSGYIENGVFYKTEFKNTEDILQKCSNYQAVIISSKWGIEAIKKFRRDIRSKTTLLVVLKGNKEHLSCGADYCVRKLTKQLINEIAQVGKKTKELWQKVDTDPLTGLYSRGFMNEWLEEQTLRETPFSMVIIDIDYFKKVNDTHGHAAGDAVLSAFGNFIKDNIRQTDLAFRYGGDEFVIVLPFTDVNRSYALIERIRQKWEERAVELPDGQNIKTTLTAGVAQWEKGIDVKKIADEMLYKAKELGRNQVQANLHTRALLLGKISQNLLRENGIDVTFDPEQASVVIAEKKNISFAPGNLPLYVLGTGDVSDWLIKRERRDAVVCDNLQDIIKQLTNPPKLKLQVLPGTRTCDNNQTIPKHGAIYVVCPSRPAAAGNIAAKLSHAIKNSALVCASAESTGSVSIGIPLKTLITADWRIVGSDAPIDWAGVKVWPVDPYKHIATRYDVHKLVDEIKPHFNLVIIDCAGSLNLCSRISGDEGVLLLYREGDESDYATANWLKTFNNHNVLAMSPAEEPEIIEAENGYIISQKSLNYMYK